jgi:hypothetical protein
MGTAAQSRVPPNTRRGTNKKRFRFFFIPSAPKPAASTDILAKIQKKEEGVMREEGGAGS